MNTTLSIEFMEDSNWLGGSIYIDNLLAALSVLPPAPYPIVRMQFLSSPRTPLAKRLLSHSIIGKTSRDDLLEDIIAAVRRVHRGLVRRWSSIGRLSCAPHNELFFPAFDAKQKWRKNLYWIPDFQPHHLPELFNSEELLLRLQSFSDIANSQGILLLSSHAALADFRRFYPCATIEPRVWSFCSSIEAVPLESCLATLRRYRLPEKFLYIANQFWRHKDHATAFAALRLLRDRGMNIPIVCTGLQNDRRDSAYFELLKKDLILDDLQHQVYFLGVVPREDQIQLFRVAAAVVQPSRFEGWSTVIEDAKALGRPIIASDTDVHREQLSGVDDSHLYITSDAVDLADRIAMVWPDLQKGPAPHREKLAALKRDMKRLDAARQFVAIVDEAIAHPQRTGKNREIK